MLARFGINVVAYGRSLDDPDVYYLARAFASIAERNPGRLVAGLARLGSERERLEVQRSLVVTRQEPQRLRLENRRLVGVASESNDRV